MTFHDFGPVLLSAEEQDVLVLPHQGKAADDEAPLDELGEAFCPGVEHHFLVGLPPVIRPELDAIEVRVVAGCLGAGDDDVGRIDGRKEILAEGNEADLRPFLLHLLKGEVEFIQKGFVGNGIEDFLQNGDFLARKRGRKIRPIIIHRAEGGGGIHLIAARAFKRIAESSTLRVK